jgi:NAD-dependent dihydropyrimidine dehydrogenase PreA subunit
MTETNKLRFDVAVNSAWCKDCKFCSEVCTKHVFESSNSFNLAGYQYMVALRTDDCNGCLKCTMICPDFAVTVERQEDVAVPPTAAGRTGSPSAEMTN